MKLTQHVLQIVTTTPGIRRRELMARLPGASPHSIRSALELLMQTGRIESAGYGCYRAAEQRRPSSVGGQGQFIPPGQVIPLSRLMAGR